MIIRSGEVYRVGRAASVQFSREPKLLRLIRVEPSMTHLDGWAWVEGYVLDPFDGEATARREIFVRLAGLEAVAAEPQRQLARAA